MATPEMRHWGWGEDDRAPAPNQALIGWLSERLGGLGPEQAPASRSDFKKQPTRLSGKERRRIESVVGSDGLSTGMADRLVHATGKSYPDIVRMRAGGRVPLPDAVVRPSDRAQVAALLSLCARRGIAVVPFGGGTSVVGGVDPDRGDHHSVISLDTGSLRSIVDVDSVSRIAVLQAGLRGPEVEHELQKLGLTLGHFPQSFEYSTVGGWVATRSAGQASSGYGRIDDLVRGVSLVAPEGELELMARPASAAGPDLRELVVGSEGTLGVITDVALQVAPKPEETRYEAFLFPSFAAGTEAFRALAQEEIQPDITRLSDESETGFYLAAAGLEGTRRNLLGGYLKARGADLDAAALAVLGWEGAAGSTRERRSQAMPAVRAQGGVSIGTGPGHAWAKGRFEGPYLRDELMSVGVMVETLETATTWSNAAHLYRAVRGALENHAPVVGCHVSHVYPSGCCLYFTFLARQDPDDLIGQWEAVKGDACKAIVTAGGTITHHHGIGADHRRYLKKEDGKLGIGMLRAAKKRADPTGVMNPGKLI